MAVYEMKNWEARALQPYISLAKPGIIWGNSMTAIGGFALASKGFANWPLFFSMLLGLSLIIGSACVFNNVIDRKADEKMARTRNRPLVTRALSPSQALVFASSLLPLGTLGLILSTNALTTATALAGFFFYVGIYSFWKYRSVHGTLLGSIAGGAPPLVGYFAVRPELDLGALALFLILIFWQMPHFYSIAIVRSNDYAAASIPVLPVIKGIQTTKIHIFFYTLGFGCVVLLPTVFGYTGYFYAACASILSATWIWLSIQGFRSSADLFWARKIFLSSLAIILSVCLLFFIDGIL